jgi:phosphoribosylformylglycinamidine cyclo-ligase
VTALPEVPPVLQFLVSESGMSPREAYSTFNMGAGLAVYVPAEAARDVVAASQTVGWKAIDAGVVVSGKRSVVLEPIGVVLENAEYQAPVAG